MKTRYEIIRKWVVKHNIPLHNSDYTDLIDRLNKGGYGPLPASKPAKVRRPKNEFVQGLGYAIAWIVRYHDESTIAKDLMKNSGFTLADFKKHCDEYDFKVIREMVGAREGR